MNDAPRPQPKEFDTWINIHGVRVIVPMKPLPYTKMRLREELSLHLCDALVLLMLKSVLSAVKAWSGPRNCLVLGGDEPIRRLAGEAGVEWAEEKAHGLNEAMTIAMREAFDDGMEAVFYLPGDVPFVEEEDLGNIMLGRNRIYRPVGVPSRTGGTNALLVPAGNPITLSFGENSYARHREAAKQAGTRILTKKLPLLMFDIDSVSDVSLLFSGWPPLENLLGDWVDWLHGGMDEPSPEGAIPRDAIFYRVERKR